MRLQITKAASISEVAQRELEDRLAHCEPEPAYEDSLPIIVTPEQAEALAAFVSWGIYYGELRKAKAATYVGQVLEQAGESAPEELKQLYHAL